MDSEGWRTVQPRRLRTVSLRPHQPSPPQRAQVYLPYSFPPTYAQVLVAPPPTAYLPAPTTQLLAPTTTQQPAYTNTAVPHPYQPNFPPPPNLAPHHHLTTLPSVPVIHRQTPLANSAFFCAVTAYTFLSTIKAHPHQPSFSFHPLALLFYISHLPRTTLNGATATFAVSAGATFEVTVNFHPLVPTALVLATPTTPALAERTGTSHRDAGLQRNQTTEMHVLS